MSVTLLWWYGPVVFTVVGLLWALFIVEVGDGWFAGLANVAACLAVFALSAPVWAIAAFLK